MFFAFRGNAEDVLTGTSDSRRCRRTMLGTFILTGTRSISSGTKNAFIKQVLGIKTPLEDYFQNQLVYLDIHLVEILFYTHSILKIFFYLHLLVVV